MAQLRSDRNSPQRNLDLIRECAETARKRDCHLVLTPELFVTSYNPKPLSKLRDFAQPLEGSYVKVLTDIARSTGVDIITGFPEILDGTIYNTAVWVTWENGGSLRLVYRKTHLWGPAEKEIFKQHDNDFPIVEFRGIKCGLIICYDCEMVEPSRILALRGCEVMFVPTALAAGSEIVPRVMVPSRALENALFVVYCNHAGFLGPFAGCSVAVGPDGSDIARGGPEEALLVATLDGTRKQYREAVESSPYLTDRRPELYADILKTKKEGPVTDHDWNSKL
uniref:CN hydrolase domain-containing protein n=1 Tax=Chromera velia CCMP2878 TaxID=1169474 RepID=A0A0G4HPS5_9ALVE|eukprot:Cvel_7799.t1-p1 / transcript=Cvel_7799.t1 / gene=Cvel_7799 / organism=Chromera_velia_CCMP2878 / gene_product=UPF0012 hydrolase in pqqF 5'region, putative / transcript_product=UPF0012 hydrolase in pqqF 5'region, putative / location=Cvel_scaffold416:11913-14284(+) / protein_length=279 / sequence_SO=supercontig / SO=protein_coding / is_pseudo=false